MTATAYTCPYCRQPSDGGAASCPVCGAPVDIALRTTSGGWLELPGIADMTRIQAGHSSIEIEGEVAPVADWNLGAGDTVYFPHHKLLWQDAAVTLSAMPMSKPFSRMRAGLPMVMAQATGPGHVAFSHDAAAGQVRPQMNAPAIENRYMTELRAERHVLAPAKHDSAGVLETLNFTRVIP